MTTKSIRPVTRESSALVRDKGMRPVIATISGSLLELRAKGLRSREVLDLAYCYGLAVKLRVESEKAQRRALRKQRSRFARWSGRSARRGEFRSEILQLVEARIEDGVTFMSKQSKLLKVLQPAQFDAAVVKFPRLSETGRAVARAVLVDGETLGVVADRWGIHRSQAHQWAAKVFDGHRPDGWVTETVTLPESAMRKVRAMVATERARWEARAAKRPAAQGISLRKVA